MDEELKQDLREIKTDIGEIKTTLAVNTESLQIHVRRTNMNEARIEKLEYWLLGILASILVTAIARGLL